jgi:prepilin-type processing-associated H-X9-DG protein
MEIKNRSKLKQPGASALASAFTVLELLVIVGVLALLLSLLIPTMSKSGLSSRAFQCLNNNRLLCNAWRMYADDNRDLIVYASDDGAGTTHPANQYAWTWMHLDFNPGDRAAWDPNVDLAQRPLWPYTGRNVSVYKCPSDPSALNVNGTVRPRLRSMAMNIYLGGFAGTDGGWPFVTPYQIYFKTTELTAPTPSKTFVFVDERWDAISWGGFMTAMTGYTNNPTAYVFYDLPGMYHNLGSSFSFADGHTELHRWTDPRTTPPMGEQQVVTFPIESPRNPDIAWLQDHSTRPK